jgi:DNA-binding CsgD family transcriptional regulator
MFLKQVGELTRFLTGSTRTIEELSKFLVFKTFSQYSPTALYIAEITEDGYLSLTGGFGFEKSAIANWGRFPLTAHIPVTDSVRNDRCILIDSVEEIFERYPSVSELGDFSTDWGAAMAWPMLPYGVGFSFLQIAPTNSEEFEDFLRLVGSVVTLYLLDKSNASPVPEFRGTKSKKIAPTVLSPRQKVILEMLSKGATNAEIALEVGYSESLIRQETMEIYRIMGVSGRKELITAAGEK